jgi:uncharacterized membrane protein YgaE (UPF0421/DUF939 family)
MISKKDISNFFNSNESFVSFIVTFYLLLILSWFIPFNSKNLLMYIFVGCIYFITVFFLIRYGSCSHRNEVEHKCAKSIANFLDKELEKLNWDNDQVDELRLLIVKWQYSNDNQKYPK